jgi:hypothetical protein
MGNARSNRYSSPSRAYTCKANILLPLPLSQRFATKNIFEDIKPYLRWDMVSEAWISRLSLTSAMFDRGLRGSSWE